MNAFPLIRFRHQCCVEYPYLYLDLYYKVIIPDVGSVAALRFECTNIFSTKVLETNNVTQSNN